MSFARALFFDSLSSLITLTCYFRSHRAGSQLKMSESQTGAGNQEFEFECYWKLSKHWKSSLGHVEQLLFSCLCSYVTVYWWKLPVSGPINKNVWKSDKRWEPVKFSSLILETCCITFVFMSMLKSVRLSGYQFVRLLGCQVWSLGHAEQLL